MSSANPRMVLKGYNVPLVVLDHKMVWLLVETIITWMSTGVILEKIFCGRISMGAFGHHVRLGNNNRVETQKLQNGSKSTTTFPCTASVTNQISDSRWATAFLHFQILECVLQLTNLSYK